MTIGIELTPEEETRLRTKAKQRGKDIREYIVDLAVREVDPADWELKLRSLGIKTGVSLSDYAVSRDSIYEDHL